MYDDHWYADEGVETEDGGSPSIAVAVILAAIAIAVAVSLLLAAYNGWLGTQPSPTTYTR